MFNVLFCEHYWLFCFTQPHLISDQSFNWRWKNFNWNQSIPIKAKPNEGLIILLAVPVSHNKHATRHVIAARPMTVGTGPLCWWDDCKYPLLVNIPPSSGAAFWGSGRWEGGKTGQRESSQRRQFRPGNGARWQQRLLLNATTLSGLRALHRSPQFYAS